MRLKKCFILLVGVMSLMTSCSLEDNPVSDEALLPGVDYAKAFAAYLLSHGMSQQQLDALVQVLTAK